MARSRQNVYFDSIPRRLLSALAPLGDVIKPLVRGSGKDAREEAPQATTEHLVANI